MYKNRINLKNGDKLRFKDTGRVLTIVHLNYFGEFKKGRVQLTDYTYTGHFGHRSKEELEEYLTSPDSKLELLTLR